MNVFSKLSPEPMPKLRKGAMKNVEFKPARTLERERKEFRADRIGSNGRVPEAKPSRIIYIAHGKGWVMARHPGCQPFAIREELWLSFPHWGGE